MHAVLGDLARSRARLRATPALAAGAPRARGAGTVEEAQSTGGCR